MVTTSDNWELANNKMQKMQRRNLALMTYAIRGRLCARGSWLSWQKQ